MGSVQLESAAARLRAAFEKLGIWPAQAAAQRALTDSMLRYVALLAKWNRTYNLTAVRDAEQMLAQHVFDCAAVAIPLKRLVEQRRADRPPDSGRPRVIDVGSGAGLPGVVLALLWPEADFVLVEPVGKKAAFLQQVKTELSLANVEIARCRIEDLAFIGPPPDAIVCRAFASLADYAVAVEALAAPHTVVAAMKARPDEQEKRALTPGWRVADEIALQVPELDARRSLIVLERASSVNQEQEPRE